MERVGGRCRERREEGEKGREGEGERATEEERPREGERVGEGAWYTHTHRHMNLYVLPRLAHEVGFPLLSPLFIFFPHLYKYAQAHTITIEPTFVGNLTFLPQLLLAIDNNNNN